MHAKAKNTTSTLVATMRYRDAKAAIEFLKKAFGFKEHLVVPDGQGGIVHAQLTYGNGMIMLGPARDDEYGRLVKTPADVGGVVTQAAYIVVEDADAHYDKAVKAGAEIVIDIKTEDYGSRGYTCRDPEGQLWNFGTYDPWSE